MPQEINAKEAIKCILWGGYGGGNFGDELTLAVALHDMQQRFGESVAVLSPLPGYTQALFPDAKIISYTPLIRKSPNHSLPIRIIKYLNRQFAPPHPPQSPYDVEDQLCSDQSRLWAEAIKQCELLYLVGGGYLTDLFNIDRFLLPVNLAQSNGIKIETAPLGIGPFTHSWNAHKLHTTLQGAKVRVRDKDSHTILSDSGIVAEQQRDDGFRIREVISFSNHLSNERKLIGINFYHQHGGIEREAEITWWKEMLGILMAGGFQVEGFCFHNDLASDFSQTVQLFIAAGLPANLILHPHIDFRDACRDLLNYQAIITARFHAAVVANTLGTPAIAIANGNYYSSKMKAACQGASKSRAVNFHDISPNQVVDILKRFIALENHA